MRGILLAAVTRNSMLAIFCMVIAAIQVKQTISAVEDSEWTGRIFPDTNPIPFSNNDEMKYDHHGRMRMGVKDKHCDWAEDPLGLDGDLGPQKYGCFEERYLYRPNSEVTAVLHEDHIPKNYVPWHHCMNESITYKQALPTYGDHRPLWPRYGEYKYLPKQRWIHSLEHGSIVMLYHPCADRNEIKVLRTLLKKCLYQYVISAWNELDSQRPMVLIAWGSRLHISKVHPPTVIDFIRNRAFKAPENVTEDGQYDKNLIELASTNLKGQEDNLCPYSIA